MSIRWADQSDPRGRFFLGEPEAPLSIPDALAAMADILVNRIAGTGRSTNYDRVFFQINGGTGLLLATLGTAAAFEDGTTEGCGLRLPELALALECSADPAGAEATIREQFEELLAESREHLAASTTSSGVQLVLVEAAD